MKMSRAMTIVMLMSFMVMVYGNDIIAESHSNDLLRLTEDVQKENGRIEEWTVHTRERLNKQEMKEVALKLQQYLSEWTFTMNAKEDQEVLTAHQSTEKLHQKLQIVSSGQQDGHYFLLYTITSTDEQRIKTFMKREFVKIYSQFSQDSTRVFTCVKGSFDGKIKEVLSNEFSGLINGWKARELEVVSEEDFYSMSAYSERFEQDLPLPLHQMNIQIGLRKNGSGAKTNFVIGTPIITTEY
ncbi:YwmB family TATA-box binding protein [Bacillus sp. REN10]|uniref:YwmB family TATA-box binding protein n=1 Tax=Bacillus sp. REN10 TaxID=2782541 RepID=UPI00193C684B|nr:YwmB family TATA-box binding protein [Bacillus sp. REN10]